MDFPVKTNAPAATRTACAIVPIYEDSGLGAVAKQFDRAAGGMLGRMRRSGDLSGKQGTSLLVPNLGSRVAAKRLLLVGCGKAKDFGAKEYGKALATAANVLAGTGVRDAASFLAWDGVPGMDAYYRARRTVERFRGALYRFTEQKSSAPPLPKLNKVSILVKDKSEVRDSRRGVRDGQAIADGVNLARDLGNRSANLCTPTHLADTAKNLAKQHQQLKATILSEKEIKQHKMGAFLSVTEGTKEPAKFIVLQYNGAKKTEAPIVLVGKGITFDTGGISLKPPPAMDEMKYDMAGAASVLGTVAAISQIGAEINVVGLVPACENMPSGRATKPGDIVTTLSGQTVEILNTDAEGRLILCDALTYAKRFKPQALIDVATLTGACILALGRHNSGLFSNDDDLAGTLTAAAVRAEDPIWRLPAGPEYGETLKSNFADFANVGSREGGASIAASFLSRFVGGTAWAHLDIAGTAWTGGKSKAASGRPVPLLTDYLLAAAKAS